MLDTLLIFLCLFVATVIQGPADLLDFFVDFVLTVLASLPLGWVARQ